MHFACAYLLLKCCLFRLYEQTLLHNSCLAILYALFGTINVRCASTTSDVPRLIFSMKEFLVAFLIAVLLNPGIAET